ncbi:MAG TPA: site-specific integrase, partial [Arenicellales bacterium]|nr:site-specific integrase [Arenicellales bacterium]
MHTEAGAQLDRFFEHLRSERRLSPHTEKAYRQDLARLARFCDRRSIDRWTGLDPRQARTFPAELHQQGLAAGSIQRILSAARA